MDCEEDNIAFISIESQNGSASELSTPSGPSGEIFSELGAVLATKEEDEEVLQPIKIEELFLEQAHDKFCLELCHRLTDGEGIEISVHENRDGLVVRNGNEVHQIVVPFSVSSKVLLLSYQVKTAGHPEGRKLYHTLQSVYYWPSMALKCYATARGCATSAQSRIELRRHSTYMKLFPSTMPSELVPIEILVEQIRIPLVVATSS